MLLLPAADIVVETSSASNIKAFMLAMFLDAVKGVDALHGQGMIHTDLKPENIMFNCEEGRVELAVLGVANQKPCCRQHYLQTSCVARSNSASGTGCS